MEEEALTERKEKLFSYLTDVKKKKNWLIYIFLAIIAYYGYYVRTLNLGYLVDPTSGKYIPSDPDAMGILRYVEYVVENGRLMDVDYMRFFPTGFGDSVGSLAEFQVLSHLIAIWYKFLHFFNSAVTVQYADVIYPAAAFVLALLFFFLMIRKVFDWKVALLASAFLTVLPAYLFRTMAGVSDKEAMAMIFLYLGIWLFISFFVEKKFKRALIYCIGAGLTIGLLWLLWGGVSFVLVTIGCFAIIVVALEKMNKQRLWLYTLFIVIAVAMLRIWFPTRASVSGLLTSATTAIMFLGLGLGWVHYFLFTKMDMKAKVGKVQPFFVSLGIVGGLGVLLFVILYGPSTLWAKVVDVYVTLVEPFGTTRWALTVAESRQPYFTDWVSQFSWRFLLMTYVGSVLLFYETLKGIGKRAYTATGAFALFIAAFAMSRYSSSATTFNGETNLSILMYVGSLVLFIVYMGYLVYSLYKNDPEKYKMLLRANLGYIFMLLFFIFLLVGARSAVRLLFVFAPITAILAAYMVFVIVKYSMKFKESFLKFGVWLALAVLVLMVLSAFNTSTVSQASSIGPGYNQQWQYAMDWVRENTPEDAVFAHWWDYGYYVQYGGERATLSDGGNAHPAINYFIGRHLLTGQNETEALELLAAKEATHVLMISDEIGKYSAYSSIGADENYDRYSWIPAFTLDSTQSQETRDGYSLVYTGGTAFDDDFVYQDIVFPANNAGVAGFLIPVVMDNETGNILEINQPEAVIVYGDQYYNVPLRCVFFDGKEYIFEGQDEYLESCFQIVPTYQGDQANGVGAGLYLSHDVWNTVFAKLYLFGEEWEYIKEVYTDESGVPLSVYNGRIIGPLKIWEVTYPDDLNIPEEYYGTEVPEGVSAV